MKWFCNIVFQNLEGVHDCKEKKSRLNVKSEIFGPDCDMQTKIFETFLLDYPHV